MRKKPALIAAMCIGMSSLVPFAGTVSAKGSYDPNIARIANPANVCKSIPGSIERAAALFQMPIPDLSWFVYSDCVQTMARGEAVVEPADEYGSPYAQCDLLQSYGVTFPYTFHDSDSPEDQLLPDLIAKNRTECGNALFAFHAIFTALFPEGPPEGG
ncbi:MAG: hypothetical protein ABIO83_09030 [Ilumatobacteraceae bacterium]